jgi:quercetin 2,3-dioxygenase
MDAAPFPPQLARMSRPIARVVPGAFQQNAPGFRSVDRFSRDLPIEPYLVFTEFHMDRPIFGPHPHAGMTVLTYMLPDSAGAFLNRDSFGDHSHIAPGGAHATQAGAGIQHDEVPVITGTDCHGMQIWINHASTDRFVAPAAFHAAPGELPIVTRERATITVVLGEFESAKSPLHIATDVTLLDITMLPHASIAIDAPTMAFAHVLSGALANNAAATAQSMVLFADSDAAITLEAGASGANVLFAAGRPHREPIAFGGPFVGTTAEDLQEFRRRFGRGEMGQLLPLAG